MLVDDYNEWLYSVAISTINERCDHSKLLSKLNNIPYNYIHPMDVNRYDDGIDLRFRFGYEEGYSDIEIENYLNIRECSVLEMMVALARRIEDNIMFDVRYGHQYSRWFFEMLKSLGLYLMNNENFNAAYVDDRVAKFMQRQYQPNGNGGLFTIDDPRIDMRNIEVWQQANIFLTEKYSER